MTDQPSNPGEPEPTSNPAAEDTPVPSGPEENPFYFDSRAGAYGAPLPAPWPTESPSGTSPEAMSTEDTLRMQTPAMPPLDEISTIDTARLHTPATSKDAIANADTARLHTPTAAQVPLEAQPTQTQMPVFPTQPVAPPQPAPTPPAGVGRRFPLTLSAIGIIFALLGASLLIAGYNTAQANIQPERAVQMFCQDLQAHQYMAAYALLSSSYRANLSEAQFTAISQLQDQADGKIRACPVATGPGLDLSFGTPQNQTSYVVTILRDQPHSGHIALVRQSENWKVDALQQSLTGTNVAPLFVVQSFCEAIMKADYATAYNALSSRQQSLATESVFAAQFRSALGGTVKLNSCTMNYATYTVRSSTASIATTFNLTISTATGGSITTSLVTVLSLTQENGAWKVDDFSLQPSAS